MCALFLYLMGELLQQHYFKTERSCLLARAFAVREAQFLVGFQCRRTSDQYIWTQTERISAFEKLIPHDEIVMCKSVT
jgi:hypothetical protein